jgi:hypothetical protein
VDFLSQRYKSETSLFKEVDAELEINQIDIEQKVVCE